MTKQARRELDAWREIGRVLAEANTLDGEFSDCLFCGAHTPIFAPEIHEADCIKVKAIALLEAAKAEESK